MRQWQSFRPVGKIENFWEIERQIKFEEYVTAVNKPLVPVPIERKEFSRTELKRLVRQVPLTVVTDDQLSVAVERVLGGERDRLPHGEFAQLLAENRIEPAV